MEEMSIDELRDRVESAKRKRADEEGVEREKQRLLSELAVLEQPRIKSSYVSSSNSVVSFGDERVTLSAPVNWAVAEVGDVISVPMSHSGLTDQPSLKLYIRRACLDLFTFLDKCLKNVKMVTGCPGVGKSVEVFSYAMGQTNKRVLYIHGEEKNGFSILFKDDPNTSTSRVCYRPKFVSEPEALEQFISALLEDDGVDIIVLDGSLSWLIREVFFMMDKHPQVVLITCTSFQALGKLSQEVSLKSAPRARFVMESWREAEYDEAVRTGAPILLEPTTVNEMFFYAGGSVRLFLKSIDDVITELEIKIDCAPDMGKLIGSGGVGDASTDATNSLMAIYDGKSVVLSQFVMRKLLESVTEDFIRKARLFLPDNPVWQGWVTEAEVLHMARTQRDVSFRNNPEDATSVETWHADPGVISFTNSTDRALQGQKVGWFQPTKWNEKGFDALFRVSSHELRVIQITDASNRSFDLNVVVPFVEAMKVQVVVIVHVCGRKNFKMLKVKESGDGESRNALETVLKKIFETKVGEKKRSREDCALRDGEVPEASVTFRTICYQLQ